jgi:hypothetical protein
MKKSNKKNKNLDEEVKRTKRAKDRCSANVLKIGAVLPLRLNCFLI